MPLEPVRLIGVAVGVAFGAVAGPADADGAGGGAGAETEASSCAALASGVVGTWSGDPCGELPWLLLPPPPLWVELRLSGRCGFDDELDEPAAK